MQFGAPKTANFNGQLLQLQSICNHIIAQVKMSSYKSILTYKHNWFDFTVLTVPIHLSREPIIKEVIWILLFQIG